MKRTTIKDLAQMLNLAPSTVSRALSNHPDISDHTKKRVLEAAETFNYSTNIHARLFRKQHSGLIALVLPEINMFYTPNILRGINKEIASSNYSLITFLSNDRFKIEKIIVQQCLNWAVEGVLMSLSNQTYNSDHLKPLSDAKINCVLMDKSLDDAPFPSVVIDSNQACYKAINHLIKNGHVNILGIFGNPGLRISKDRVNGYKKAFKEHNLEIVKENIIYVDDSKNIDFILPPILNHNHKITALFTMSDELLSKSLYHINKLGISIPNDLSIISISDGQFPYLVHPQITHILDSGSKMGRNACKLLIENIEERIPNQNKNTVLSTKLKELNSVANIN